MNIASRSNAVDRRPFGLVTGASSGIGREIALLLGEAGCDLALVARNSAALETLAQELDDRFGVKATPIEADLAQADAPARIARQLSDAGIAVDYLVNNAGFGARGPTNDQSETLLAEMIQVNVAALTVLTRLILPGMLKRGRGRILNVASTAAFQPVPFLSVYGATKAYVLSFSEALAVELRGSGVTVTCLCPSATATNFASVAGMAESAAFRFGVASARDVAQIGVTAMVRGQSLALPGLFNRMRTAAVKFLPRSLVIRAAGQMMSR